MSKKQNILKRKSKNHGRFQSREAEDLSKLKEELSRTFDQILENQFSNYASQRLKEFNCKLK